jgi:hypothetical protein
MTRRRKDIDVSIRDPKQHTIPCNSCVDWALQSATATSCSNCYRLRDICVLDLLSGVVGRREVCPTGSVGEQALTSTLLSLVFNPCLTQGRGIAQEVSRRLPTTSTPSLIHLRSHAIYCGQNGSRGGFPPSTPVSPTDSHSTFCSTFINNSFVDDIRVYA